MLVASTVKITGLPEAPPVAVRVACPPTMPVPGPVKLIACVVSGVQLRDLPSGPVRDPDVGAVGGHAAGVCVRRGSWLDDRAGGGVQLRNRVAVRVVTQTWVPSEETSPGSLAHGDPVTV